MNNELLHQVALTLVPQIGPVQAKILLQHCEPEEIFHAKKHFLEKIEGIGPFRAQSILAFRDFDRAAKEIAFMEKHEIQPLFLTDENYPKRLLNCTDAPTLLYYKGRADLNASRMISIIGTRKPTDYGKLVTEKIVSELGGHGISIVSGMAFGIDALAHRAALQNNLPTVGVLAHGLDQIYPPPHAGLARELIRSGGGLLTEFPGGTDPDRHHFPSRNRIVAGMCDATLVIETDIKGGSMITAELANGYNRDVFAIPGRSTDSKSSGCHHLIRKNKAGLMENAFQLLEWMGWLPEAERKKIRKTQRALFVELSPAQQVITTLLNEKETMHIDELNLRSGLSAGTVATAILELELQNVIVSLPGKLYRLS